MAEPYIGQIMTFAFPFAPRGYALCEGQLLAISTNGALYSLIGTVYGGDGMTSFGLPDMRGRLPMHQGHGPGLSSRPMGAKIGTETVTLTAMNLPHHTHTIGVLGNAATSSNATDKVLAATQTVNNPYKAPPANAVMASQTVSSSGGNQPHSNMMPSITINFCIALYGVFPLHS